MTLEELILDGVYIVFKVFMVLYFLNIAYFAIEHFIHHSMSIKIVEAISKKELRAFVDFPFKLYEKEKNWIPPLISDELDTLNHEKNPVFEVAQAHYFLAYKEGIIVGRIAAIINTMETKKKGIPKIRFGWFDFIDDLSVSQALLEKVNEIGKEQNLSFMEGPMGFCNLDKAGLLTRGFEFPNTMVTWYNYPYYAEHLKELGFKKASKWVEYYILSPKTISERISQFSESIKKRYKLQVVRFKNKKELKVLAKEIFSLLDATYERLSSYLPITEKQKSQYTNKFLKFIHLDYIICIKDSQERLIAFAITMPSYSKALKKAKGKLFPFGIFYLLKAHYQNDTVAFYLIGVLPKFQSKGVIAIIFEEFVKMFQKRNIKYLETNPELEENKNIQALWKNYDFIQHKARCTFRKDL